jgi:mannitol-specific phosphotransferase system IIBC component
MQSFENKRKTIAIVLAVLAGIVIVIMGASILNKGNKTNNTNNATQNTINYVATNDGNKVNTSEQVATDKKIGQILIEKSAIVYEKGTSKLTSKVTNDSLAKDNLRFTVKFIANDGSVIAQSVGFVGSIKENETKYIDSYITADVSNVKDITYEIME